MVCPNCQSDNIVELQNQHFCINCGRLIDHIVKKRGPGRPKADRLDKPKALTMKLAAAAVSSIDKPLDSTPRENEAIEGISEQADPLPSKLPIISHSFHAGESVELPELVAKKAEVNGRKRLQDIVPADIDTPAVPTLQTKKKSNLATPKSIKSHISLAEIISSSWSEPWQGGPARMLIFSAVVASLITSASVAVVLTHLSKLSNTIALGGFVALALGIALIFGVANTERAAFALRRYDHRPIPRSWLFGGALAVLGRQTIVLIAGILDFGLLGLLAWYIGRILPTLIEQPYVAASLFVIYFLITVLVLCVWVKTGLGSAGVELGQMKSLDALKFGWRSLWRHPELLGTRLVAALWLAASLSGVVALAFLIHLYLPSYNLIILIISSGLLAFTAVLLGNFGAVGWRQASYRELVIVDEPTNAIAMLSGHHNGAPSTSAKYSYVFAISLLILGGIGAVITSFYR